MAVRHLCQECCTALGTCQDAAELCPVEQTYSGAGITSDICENRCETREGAGCQPFSKHSSRSSACSLAFAFLSCDCDLYRNRCTNMPCLLTSAADIKAVFASSLIATYCNCIGFASVSGASGLVRSTKQVLRYCRQSLAANRDGIVATGVTILQQKLAYLLQFLALT